MRRWNILCRWIWRAPAIIRWLERGVIPKNRAFVDEILKTLGLGANSTKSMIDICKGLSLNDSYWMVPEDFEGTFAQYNLYENRFSETLALVAYTGAPAPATGNPSPLQNKTGKGIGITQVRRPNEWKKKNISR